MRRNRPQPLPTLTPARAPRARARQRPGGDTSPPRSDAAPTRATLPVRVNGSPPSASREGAVAVLAAAVTPAFAPHAQPASPPAEQLPPWLETWDFEIPSAEADSPLAAEARAAARRAARRRTRSERRTQGGGGRAATWRPSLPSKVVVAIVVLVGAAGAWAAVPHHSSAGSADPVAGAGFPSTASRFARADIPPSYMRLYLRAARAYHLDWATLAAVGQIESDHGRSRFPGVRAGTNFAGAAGPAQFLARTWTRYGVDGNNDGTISPYDPADAIPAMAAYLRATGAPQNWPRALFAYNHSQAYVASVLQLSRRYEQG